MAEAPGWRFCVFTAAIVLYAVSGSPTPDAIGLSEILTGGLLVLSVSPRSVIGALSLRSGEQWRNAGQMLLFYGLSVPLLTGFIAGHSLQQIIRDIIPFCFFLLPVFILPFADARARLWAAYLTVLVGMAFSARILMSMTQEFSFGLASSDPLYLSIAPTVCFAAIWCGGMAGKALYDGLPPRAVMISAGYAVLALLPMAAMSATLQRASLGLSIMALAVLLLAAFIRAPLRAMPVILLILCALAVMWGPASDVMTSLMHKHGAVGMNMRLQEASAVSDTMNSAWSVLFGRGWGATVSSPAVGGVVINYTHCLLTAFWMKTGLAGLGLAGAYLFWLGWGVILAARRWPVAAAAISVPFLIDTFLYASYKSLDFGLILLLAAVFGASESCARPIPSVSTKAATP